jgi:hypothetical protein
MAQGLTCDRCGKPLLVDEPLRYIAKLEVYAAYDPLEITRHELERRDTRAEIQRLLVEIERRNPTELEAEVHERIDLDLCPPCRKAFVDTLPGRAAAAPPPPAAPQG